MKNRSRYVIEIVYYPQFPEVKDTAHIRMARNLAEAADWVKEKLKEEAAFVGEDSDGRYLYHPRNGGHIRGLDNDFRFSWSDKDTQELAGLLDAEVSKKGTEEQYTWNECEKHGIPFIHGAVGNEKDKQKFEDIVYLGRKVICTETHNWSFSSNASIVREHLELGKAYWIKEAEFLPYIYPTCGRIILEEFPYYWFYTSFFDIGKELKKPHEVHHLHLQQ